MDSQVYFVLELQIQPGKADDYKAIMDELVGASQNETETLNYEWNLSEDSNTVHVYERYANSAALMVHLNMFGENYAERFLEIFAPVGLNVYGAPSDEAKEALAGFGARHFKPVGGFAR